MKSFRETDSWRSVLHKSGIFLSIPSSFLIAFSAVALADYDLKQGIYKINYSATNDWFPAMILLIITPVCQLFCLLLQIPFIPGNFFLPKLAKSWCSTNGP